MQKLGNGYRQLVLLVCAGVAITMVSGVCYWFMGKHLSTVWLHVKCAASADQRCVLALSKEHAWIEPVSEATLSQIQIPKCIK